MIVDNSLDNIRLPDWLCYVDGQTNEWHESLVPMI